jgi:hypothetical protein
MAESETDRASRMHDRAEALAAKADRKGTAAEARWNAGQRIADAIPAGQPILVGHHSEPRHRRDLRRIDAHHHASAELAHEAEVAANGAQTAQQHMDHREAPGVTARRIERLQAERRRVQRGIDGHTRNFRNNAGEIYRREVSPPASGQALEHYTLQAAHLDEQIAYWTRLLAEHQSARRWNPVNPTEIRKGDLVRAGRQWREVVRVTTKTVTVTTDYFSTDKLPLTDIREHRKAAATVDLPAEAEEVAP